MQRTPAMHGSSGHIKTWRQPPLNHVNDPRQQWTTRAAGALPGTCCQRSFHDCRDQWQAQTLWWWGNLASTSTHACLLPVESWSGRSTRGSERPPRHMASTRLPDGTLAVSQDTETLCRGTAQLTSLPNYMLPSPLMTLLTEVPVWHFMLLKCLSINMTLRALLSAVLKFSAFSII